MEIKLEPQNTPLSPSSPCPSPLSSSLPQKFKFTGLKWRTQTNLDSQSDFHDTIMESICKSSIDQIRNMNENSSKMALHLLELCTLLPRHSISIELLHFIHLDLQLDCKALNSIWDQLKASLVFQACQILEKSCLISIVREKSRLGHYSLELSVMRVHRHVDRWVRLNLISTQSKLDCLLKLSNYLKNNIFFFVKKSRTNIFQSDDLIIIKSIQNQLRENNWPGKSYRQAIFFAHHLNSELEEFKKIYEFFLKGSPKLREDEPYFDLCRIYLILKNHNHFNEVRGKQLCNVILNNSQLFDELNRLRLIRLDDFIHWVLEIGGRFKDNILVQNVVEVVVNGIVVDGGSNLNDETKYRMVDWRMEIFQEKNEEVDVRSIFRMMRIRLSREEWMRFFLRRIQSRLSDGVVNSIKHIAAVRCLKGWPRDIWKIGSFASSTKELEALQICQLFLLNGGLEFLKCGLNKTNKLIPFRNNCLEVIMDLTYFHQLASILLQSSEFLTVLKELLGFLLIKPEQNVTELKAVVVTCLSLFARKENAGYFTKNLGWQEMKVATQIYRKLDSSSTQLELDDVETNHYKILQTFLVVHDEASGGNFYRLAMHMTKVSSEPKMGTCALT